MNQIEKAIKIALEAHTEQKDKAGETYILHPLRLMLQMETEEEKVVAVLHDVIEDSEYTFEDLRHEGFSAEVVDAIDCVTKREGEDYDEFIERIVKNTLAARVKIADLKDNSNLDRLENVTDKDRERADKYKEAIAKLESVNPYQG